MISITTIDNGIYLREQDRLFTSDILDGSLQVLNDFQVWVEVDSQIVFFDIADTTIDGEMCVSMDEFVTKLNIPNGTI